MSSLLNYMNFMTIYQRMTNAGGEAGGINSGDLSVTEMLQAAKEQGWITAGGFYWAVEEANSTSKRADISNLVPDVHVPSAITIGSNPTANTTDWNASVYYFYRLGYVVNHYWNTYVNAQKNTVDLVDVTGSQSNSDSDTAAAALSQNALGDSIQSMFQLTRQNNMYNPIVILMHEGNNLLIGVVTTWMLAITISTVLAAAAGFCNSTSPAGLMFKTAMGWIKSIMMLVTSAMLVPGAIMAYYLPIYPFAVFTFASIGWFAMVIEGMAAAPLVCFGMTHPEGHDFLGKGEQALMLILGIFLRPTLLVMGLIAFMLTSFVAFELLLAGLGPLLNSFQQTQSGALNDDFLVLISTTMMLVVFGFMVMEVVEQSAKIIYQLPNNIMRWIGGPQMGEEYGQMAGQLKGAVSTTAELSGKGAQLGADTGEMGAMGAQYEEEQAKWEADQKKGGAGSATP
jgi:defect-in-organelle-trafficking protein DotA